LITAGVNKNPFSTVKIHFDPVEREVLTKTELVTLMQTDMEIERLDRMRDIFVFSCYTGLAHCDVANLTAENIVTDDRGQLWIKTHRKKTAEPVDVPLLEIPQLILNKYKGIKDLHGKLLPILTNSCCNIYLKKVATKCGIKKTSTFHMARHLTLRFLLSGCKGRKSKNEKYRESPVDSPQNSL